MNVAANDVLSVDQVRENLAYVRDLCGTAIVTDIHVHATEVIRDAIRYHTLQGDVFESADGANYTLPKMANARLSEPGGEISTFQLRLSEMSFQRAYRHTGSRVLIDQLELAEVDRAVLLPVAHNAESLAEQMRVIDQCTQSSSRFMAGYSLPPEVDNDEIEAHLAKAIDQHDVQILKVHANVCGIDLSSIAGKSRVEAILRASGRLGLPSLFHGGCSPILGDAPASKFSTVDKLWQIDWSLCLAPVVIAHFGIYGCLNHQSDASLESQAKFAELLDSFDHLYTDTSGVPYTAIYHMLGKIDPARVVFGSDALYVPVYRQLALLVHAFKELQLPAAALKAVVSDNAKNILAC